MECNNQTEDLETGCDLPFEHSWWRLQSIIWIILLLLLVGGVTGVFGHGPFSRASVHPNGSRVRVDYDWLARRETPSILQLHLDKAALVAGKVRIRLNRALIDRMQLQHIVPPPLSAEPLADGVRFTFQTDPASDSALLIFTENPTTPGFVNAEVAIEGAEAVRFRQFIYP